MRPPGRLPLGALAGCAMAVPLTGWAASFGVFLHARDQWESRNPSDYHFVLERQCYCAGPNRVRIRVSGGQVTDVVDLESDLPIEDPEVRRGYPTVAELLSLIDDARRKTVDNLTITYHRTLGYPSRIYIDYSYRMADDEVDYRLSEMVVESVR